MALVVAGSSPSAESTMTKASFICLFCVSICIKSAIHVQIVVRWHPGGILRVVAFSNYISCGPQTSTSKKHSTTPTTTMHDGKVDSVSCGQTCHAAALGVFVAFENRLVERASFCANYLACFLIRPRFVEFHSFRPETLLLSCWDFPR